MNNTKIWFTSVILILIVFIFAFFDDLFMTILIAAVLAFLLNPITNWFHKLLKTKKRTIPTLLTMLLALAAVGGLLIGFLALKGYDLFKGKQGKGKVAILIVIVLLFSVTRL